MVWGPEHLRKPPTLAGVRESFAQFVRIWLAQPPPIEGQRVYALRLRDGSTVWTGPTLAKTRPTEGHTSGTPTVSNGIGVVLLPIADKVVAFRPSDGRMLWSRPAFASRGPVLVDSGRVYAIGRRGEVRVWSLASGDSLCATTIARHFDRAGPIVAGPLFIVGTLEGTVIAIPRAAVDRCARLDLDQRLPEIAAVTPD